MEIKDKVLSITTDYWRLFKNSPVAMIVVDAHNLEILEVNHAATEHYGYSEEEFQHLKIEEIAGETMTAALLAAGDGNQLGFWKHTTKTGESIDVEMHRQQLTFQDEDALLLVLNDVTEQMKAQDALKESEERFSKAFHSSPMAICITRLEDGFFIDVNDSFLKTTGYSREEVKGKTSIDLNLWDPPTRQKFLQILRRQGFAREFEHTFRQKSGEFKNTLIYAEIIELGGIPCNLIMIRDITLLRRNEAELRSLASQLSLTEERERRRIATDLHDLIGQNLAMAKIKLGGLRKSLAQTPLYDQCEQIRDLLEATISSTRALSFELSPPMLYEFGLEPAVEWLTERMQEQYGTAVNFQDDRRKKPLDDSVKVLLFTAIRELLLNVVKHSKAKQAEVRIERNTDNIQVTVADNGIGFDASAREAPNPKYSGFGLFSIQQRIENLGGQLIIDSAIGGGTRVMLEAPLQSQIEEDQK